MSDMIDNPQSAANAPATNTNPLGDPFGLPMQPTAAYITKVEVFY